VWWTRQFCENFKYFQNGNLKSEFTYVNDVKEGIGKEWWENGKLSSEGFYKNGKSNGLMKWYSEKGHLAARGQMIDGKRNGEWKICDWQDASFCTLGTFEDEVEVGTWISFHPNGEKARENYYDNGKITSSKCWDEKGNQMNCN